MQSKLHNWAGNHRSCLFEVISKLFELFIEQKSECLIVTRGFKKEGNNETPLDFRYILKFSQIQ